MPEDSCRTTIALGTGDTLTCNLDAGHDGPTHSDHGHEWGDVELPAPPMPEPAEE